MPLAGFGNGLPGRFGCGASLIGGRSGPLVVCLEPHLATGEFIDHPDRSGLRLPDAGGVAVRAGGGSLAEAEFRPQRGQRVGDGRGGGYGRIPRGGGLTFHVDRPGQCRFSAVPFGLVLPTAVADEGFRCLRGGHPLDLGGRGGTGRSQPGLKLFRRGRQRGRGGRELRRAGVIVAGR